MIVKNIKEKKIGMVGFGHLGSSIALALINGGFSKSNLMISYKGSEASRQRIENMDLYDCVKDINFLMEESDIVILAARPQNIREIAGNHIKDGALVMSFMAALPLASLRSFFGCKVTRTMCSGPESISEGRGVCTLVSPHGDARALLTLCGIRELVISCEDEIDAFTAGICIPPILMNIEVDTNERAAALNDMALRFPIYRELTRWIETELSLGNSQDSEKSLENVSTKGGVSEAMVSALLSGQSFLSSVERGIERCSELKSELCKNLASRAA